MKLASKIFAGLAGVIHVYIFVLESILWNTPRAMKVFKTTPEKAKITEVFAFNQGFYNLFLAIAVFLGLFLMSRQGDKKVVGTTLTLYSCASILGAAIVLFFSAPGMMKGVLVQGLAPLLALTFYALSLKQADQGVEVKE